MRRMFDAAFPPASPPDWEVVAGYIGGNTPHVWTEAEWARQRARWQLPIFTRSHDGDPAADARQAVSWLTAHHVPKGVVVALDYEKRVDASYLRAFDSAVGRAGWRVMLYGSLSTVLDNPRPSGGYWVAHWTGVAHLEPGSAATQWASDAMLSQPWDASLVADSTPLWDTRPGGGPPPEEDELAGEGPAILRIVQDIQRRVSITDETLHIVSETLPIVQDIQRRVAVTDETVAGVGALVQLTILDMRSRGIEIPPEVLAGLPPQWIPPPQPPPQP
jgi:hypothetical protein